MRLLLVLTFGAACTDLGDREPVERVDPAEVHARSILIDGHIDIPYRITQEGVDISQRLASGHFDFIRAREGGLDASFFAVYVSSKFNRKGTWDGAKGGAFKEAHRIIDLVERTVEKNAAFAEIATSPDDVVRVVGARKHAVLLGLENGSPVEGSLEKLKQLHDRGVRYVTLTHSKDNHISDSSYDDRGTHGGLSPFGRKVVAEMNRLGMLIDISHVSDPAFAQVLELTEAPVICSHSSMRAFRKMERNVSDDMLRALAKNGGVIMINFGSVFLRDDVDAAFDERDEKIAEIRKQRGRKRRSVIEKEVEAVRAEYAAKNATLEDVVKHIDHAVRLVGVDHVGLGSDYDGVEDVPIGLEDVSKYPELTRALMGRGYQAADIDKINGANLLRVWREVEAAAR